MSMRPSRSPWAVGLANHLNLQTFPLHAEQILTSAAIYQGIFSVISPAVSRWLVPNTYSKLPEKSKANWDIRVVSFVQAAFITYQALSVIFTDPSRPDATGYQRLWGYSSQAGKVQAYAAGYFLWDIYVSLRFDSQHGLSGAVHAICAFIVTMIGFRPFANYYGVNFVLYEMSTPFLNIHWMLDKVGMTGSSWQFYNGIALMSSFFGCRLVWGSYQTWSLTQDMLSAWRSGPVPKLLFGTYLLSNTTLTCLNFYWFGRMVQAMRKRFEPQKDQQGQS